MRSLDILSTERRSVVSSLKTYDNIYLNLHKLHQHINRGTVLSVNEYTPFEKYNFKLYLNVFKKISQHKNHFQNVDKTKFNITSV